MAKRRRKRKLSDDDIHTARKLILRGRSLRSVARVFKVRHQSLRNRLVILYGVDYRVDRTAEILAEYADSSDPRLAAAAQRFLLDYAPTTDTSSFYSSRRERDLTIRSTHYSLNMETFRASRGGVSCKIA